MRLRLQDSIVVRLALVATLVIAAISLTIALHNLDAGRGPQSGSTTSLLSGPDPELIRCRDLGVAAVEDESCLAAWSEEQRRFFGTSLTPPSVPSALPPAGGIEEGAVDEQAGENGGPE